jgi:ribose 5-phosphate isomerase B
MKIHIASDHAGFAAKSLLIEHLSLAGHELIDHGTDSDLACDYPKFCIAAALAVSSDQSSLGIVLGGSGNGEQIAANKVQGIRAALAWSVETAKLAREHNNANVVGIGARMHDDETLKAIAQAFIETPFPGDERHLRRIAQISEYEENR